MTDVSATSTTAVAPGNDRTFLGQPIGLATLFLTEMWERFTYYGMRANFVLFLVAAVTTGGFGMDDRTANSIYGLYTAGTYLLSLFGGWIADRLTGSQRAVWYGGILILIGNAMLASGSTQIFFAGLIPLVFGVGLLKPNISAVVAQLYPEGGSRRDAGFSIFYMGINIGAFLGSTLVPIVAQAYGWRFGFATPAVGMLIGLVIFASMRSFLGSAGVAPGVSAAVLAKSRNAWLAVIAITVAILAAVASAFLGFIHIDPKVLLDQSLWAMGLFGAAYFVYMLFFAGLTPVERKRVLVMIALFAACVMFWTGFEQTGSSLNLFAARYTDRHLFGWDMPAGLFQNINPFFIIVFSPVFAAIWVSLGKRNLDPSAPAKFALGLTLLGVGFAVMYFAAQFVVSGQEVLPTWLIFTYMFHTFGELCLSPVGLSSMSKLAPPRFVGQALGLWFLATALGNGLAGKIAGEFDPNNIAAMPGQFLWLFWWGVVGGVVMFAITPFAKKLMGGVK
ncbi:MAG TPA: peptide MFS transporter [Steroidobacteraceae bacterium]|nr:peptide MFS transporter [Steroidobacteraceae bacterium]